MLLSTQRQADNSFITRPVSQLVARHLRDACCHIAKRPCAPLTCKQHTEGISIILMALRHQAAPSTSQLDGQKVLEESSCFRMVQQYRPTHKKDRIARFWPALTPIPLTTPLMLMMSAVA